MNLPISKCNTSIRVIPNAKLAKKGQSQMEET